MFCQRSATVLGDMPLFTSAAYVNQPERRIASGFIFVIKAPNPSRQAEKTILGAFINSMATSDFVG